MGNGLMMNGGWLEGLWASVGYHGLLWLGLLVVTAIFAVALICEWRREGLPSKPAGGRSGP